MNENLFSQIKQRLNGFSQHLSSLELGVKIKNMSIFRDFVFFGKTSLESVSDAEKDDEYLNEIDENFNTFEKLISNHQTLEELSKAIIEATDSSTDEYKLREFFIFYAL